MKILSILPCMLLACLLSYSQKYFPGFFISLQGDTLKGSFPKYKEWKNNPASVEFLSVTGESMKLTPDNCKSFAVEGYDNYTTLEVKRMVNPIKVSPGGFSDNGEEVYETIKPFLRTVYSNGVITLYEFMDNRRVNYFIKKGTEISELIFYVINNDYRISEQEKFKNQLQVLFVNQVADNQQLLSKLNRLDYTSKSLVNFLNDVNKTEYKTENDIKNDEFSLLAGVSLNMMNVALYDFFYQEYNKFSYKPSFYPLLGIKYRNFFTRNFSKYFFDGSLRITGYKTQGKGLYANSNWVYKSMVVIPSAGIGRNLISNNEFSWFAAANLSLWVLLDNKRYDVNNPGQKEKGRGQLLNVGFQTGISAGKFGFWAQYNSPFLTHMYNNLHRPDLASLHAGISMLLPSKRK